MSRKSVTKAYEKADDKMRKGEILKAFEIIEKWRNSGNYCCINILSDYSYCWRIEITEDGADPHEPAYVVDGYEDLLQAVLAMNKRLPKD